MNEHLRYDEVQGTLWLGRSEEMTFLLPTPSGLLPPRETPHKFKPLPAEVAKSRRGKPPPPRRAVGRAPKP